MATQKKTCTIIWMKTSTPLPARLFQTKCPPVTSPREQVTTHVPPTLATWPQPKVRDSHGGRVTTTASRVTVQIDVATQAHPASITTCHQLQHLQHAATCLQHHHRVCQATRRRSAAADLQVDSTTLLDRVLTSATCTAP